MQVTWLDQQISWLDLLTLATAVVALVLGIVAELRHRAADRINLAFVVEAMLVPLKSAVEDYLEITVTNNGARPVGVKGVALRASDGRHIPLVEQPPDSRRLGTVLTRGESLSVVVDRSWLQPVLAEERVMLKGCLARLPDGRTIEGPVPKVFRRG